jgi:three-Cys-motif partner protein
LALTTTHPFTHYFFVDQDPDNITALQKRCSAPPFTAIVDCKTGDGNILVKEIVERIESVDRQYLPGKWSSLNLAFLDPDGLELQWQTVATLARLRTMDLIIHYSQGGLNRVMVKAVSKEADTVVDRFFGGREWRRIYERYRNREVSFIHRQLMDHYKEKLQGLGYQEVFRDDEVGDEPLIRNAERNVPLYRLLFASKHPLGQTFWRKITQRDVHGQARLL